MLIHIRRSRKRHVGVSLEQGDVVSVNSSSVRSGDCRVRKGTDARQIIVELVKADISLNHAAFDRSYQVSATARTLPGSLRGCL